MRDTLEQFGAFIAKIPMPACVLPFETLWSGARAGAVQAGDGACDFDLSAVYKSATVRLSSFRGWLSQSRGRARSTFSGGITLVVR